MNKTTQMNQTNRPCPARLACLSGRAGCCGAEGALGVGGNRPTGMSVSEALPQVPILEGQRHVLFAGGPVQTNQVMMLYRLDQLPENSHHVFDGICLGGDTDLVDRILTTSEGREAFRAYIGYSGWGPGQLESELQTG